MDKFIASQTRIGRSLLLALWLLITALTANALWLTVFAESGTQTSGPLSSAGAPTAARTPFTVVLQESTRGPAGDASLQGTITMALRGDGAFVLQYEHHGMVMVIQRTIELPSGVTIVVDDVRERRTSTLVRPGTSLRARMDPIRRCVKNDIGELVFPGQIVGDHEVVAGYDAVRVTTSKSTLWFAPGLGCAQIRSSTLLSGGGVNEQVPSAIIPGEPDNALFYVPDRYEEVPPSVFHQLEPNSPEALKLDRSYFERRPPR